MPVCRSCLKGFDSEYNICPHCNHDQSKRSYRFFLFMVFLSGLCYFIYDYSFQTIYVEVDGKPTNDFIVVQGYNKFHNKAKNGKISFFHLSDDQNVTVIIKGLGDAFVEKGVDTKIFVDTQKGSLQIYSGSIIMNTTSTQDLTPIVNP